MGAGSQAHLFELHAIATCPVQPTGVLYLMLAFHAALPDIESPLCLDCRHSLQRLTLSAAK